MNHKLLLLFTCIGLSTIACGGSQREIEGEPAPRGDAPSAFVMDDIPMHGGGTHNAVNFSSFGSHAAAFADVGGTRRLDRNGTTWEYLPTTGGNADRQVSGGVVLRDGTVLALAGNAATAGKLLEYSPAGEVSELITGLNVRGNSTTPGDNGARTRPVGWMVAYDSVNDLVYVCEDDGVLRYNRSNSTNDGRIALDGESCRGFAHSNDGTVNDTDVLTVSTRSSGLVRLFGVQGDDVLALRISDESWSRFEDSALIDAAAGTLVGAGHTDGIYRYDDGGIAVNGSQFQLGPATDVNASTYTLGAEVTLSDWTTASGTLVARWTQTTTEQQHRFSIEGDGRLRYRLRHAGGFGSFISSDVVTVGGRAWVRFRRTATDGFFEQSQDGVAWTQVGQPVSGLPVPNSVASTAWAAGATSEGSDALPSGTVFHRAWVRVDGETEASISLDATGLLSTATSYTGIGGDDWALAGTVVPGGVDITPSQKAALGVNGSAGRWSCVASINSFGAMQAAAALVNPDGPDEWIYRTTDIGLATANSWGNATPSPAFQEVGSTELTPANRVLGGTVGSGGDNLTGLWHLCFDPGDGAGNTLVASGTLSIYISTSFAGPIENIEWRTFNQGLSMLTLPDAHIDAEGNVLFASADHNSWVTAGGGLLTDEPTRLGVSGPSDAFSVFSVGAGLDKVSVLCAGDDTSSTGADADVVFHRGAGAPTEWATSGYQSDTDGIGSLTAGQVPRPGGAFGWDNRNGTYTFVVWSDGVGFTRSSYSLASDSWSPWIAQASGPVAELVTSDVNQERMIVGHPDGSLLVGMQLATGNLWRSSDGGANWSSFALSINGNEQVRKGRIAYNSDEDWLVVSDLDGLYRVDDVSTAPSVTVISDTLSIGPVAIDSAGRAYVHTHESNVIRLLRFSDFGGAQSVANAIDIAAESPYRTRIGQSATQMTIGTIDGVERGITTFQGAGACSWTVPPLE